MERVKLLVYLESQQILSNESDVILVIWNTTGMNHLKITSTSGLCWQYNKENPQNYITCSYGFWAWRIRRQNSWSPERRTKSIIQRWAINPSKWGHIQYLQTTLTIKHVAKCMHSVTVVARSLCYCPLHFQFVNVNFWCSVINSVKLMISRKTLINVSTLKVFFRFLTHHKL